MEQNSSKTWLWVVAVVVAVAAGVWLWQSRQAAAPTLEISGPALNAEDTTVAIEAELNATDFGDLEAELQSTEADLQSL